MDNSGLNPVPLEENIKEKVGFEPNFNSILVLFFAFLFSFLALFVYLLLPNVSYLSKTVTISNFSTENNFIKKSFTVENIPKETTFFDLKMKFVVENNSTKQDITFNATYTMISKENNIEIDQKGANIFNNTLPLKTNSKNDHKYTNELQIYRNTSFHGDNVNFTVVVYTKVNDIENIQFIINYNTIVFWKLNKRISSFLLIMTIIVFIYTILKSLDSRTTDEFNQFTKPLYSSFFMVILFYIYHQKVKNNFILIFKYVLEIALHTLNLHESRIFKLRILVLFPVISIMLYFVPLQQRFVVTSVYRILISLIACYVPFISSKKRVSNENVYKLTWFLLGLYSSILIFLTDFVLRHISKEVFLISYKLLYIYIDTSISLLTSFMSWSCFLKQQS